MKLHADSHVDHGISLELQGHLLERFAGKSAFFIAQVDIPAEYGPAQCGLYGPTMGDAPVAESEVTRVARGNRAYTSRIVARPQRPVRSVTVIAGPHDGEPCVVYTMFGGPLAPKEPDDPTLAPEDRDRSIEFWREHALAL